MSPAQATTSKPSGVSRALARDRLGVPAVLFFVLAGVAPLTVTAGVIPTAYATTGLTGIPAAFLVIAVILAIFAAGVRDLPPERPGSPPDLTLPPSRQPAAQRQRSNPTRTAPRPVPDDRDAASSGTAQAAHRPASSPGSPGPGGKGAVGRDRGSGRATRLHRRTIRAAWTPPATSPQP